MLFFKVQLMEEKQAESLELTPIVDTIVVKKAWMDKEKMHQWIDQVVDGDDKLAH